MRHFLAIAMILFPVFAWSETVLVRSGDHAGFSRLAFDFAEPTKWSMGRVAQGYEIRLARKNLKIDIRNVFKKITHDRIRAIQISPENNRIDISLACTCHADAFEFRSGLLVIDIKDGPPNPDSVFEKGFTQDEIAKQMPPASPTSPSLLVPSNITPSRPEPDDASPREPMQPASGQPPLLWPDNMSAPQPAPIAPERVQLPVVIPHEESTPIPVSIKTENPTAARILRMQAGIASEIGRAATQGLLTPNVKFPKPSATPHPAPANMAVTPEQASISPPEPPAADRVNMHVQTSVDRDSGTDHATSEILNGNGETCLPTSVFDLSNWGDPDNPIAAISKQRARLTTELDKVDPQAVEALAKAYIYAGFGAESQAVLSAFDITIPHQDILKTMAEIMDYGAAVDGTALQNQTDCNTAAALWATLALKAFPPGLSINSAAVKLHFSGLPLRLRQHLGPTLAQRFLAAGDQETAIALKNAITRAPGNPDPGLQMLDAHLQRIDGHSEKSQAMLREIVNRDGSLASEALAELLERKIAADEQIDPGLIASAQAQAFERRGTKIGQRLQRDGILALSKSGAYMKAAQQIQKLQSDSEYPAKDTQGLWESVLADATIHASNKDFLLLVFGSQEYLKKANIARQVRRRASKRLVAAGFPDIAVTILAADTRPDPGDRRVLAAAALEEGNTSRALELLKSATGEQAHILRAQAYIAQEKFNMAAQEFAAAQDQAGQRLAAWKSQDWQTLETLGSPSERQTAALALSRAPQPGKPASTQAGRELANSPGALAQSQTLIETSRTSREAITAILNAFPAVGAVGS